MSDTGFDDVLFPFSLALGASGGPEWRTEVVSLASGGEVRNTRWSRSRRRWDVGGTVSGLADIGVLSAFFEARMGRLRGFRLYDPHEHSSSPHGQATGPLDQPLGTGDGTTQTFQLTKTYGDWRKPISKPRDGSVRIAMDGIEMPDGWTVEPLTGAVSFDVAPTEGVVVTAGFSFDWPVRFDTDSLDIFFELIGAGRAISLPIVELV